MQGETWIQEAARQHGLTVAEIEDWQEHFLAAAENSLRSRPKDEEALKDEQIKQLKQKIGDLVLDLDILKEAMKGSRADRSPRTPSSREGPDENRPFDSRADPGPAR